MASSFKRQLKFAQALVDSSARLTAEAVLSGDLGSATRRAHCYALAQKFRVSRIWFDWKFTSFEKFCAKFHECVREGVLEV